MIISFWWNGKILLIDIMLIVVLSVKFFSVFILCIFRENEIEKKIFE